jgi:hypothetical protein
MIDTLSPPIITAAVGFFGVLATMIGFLIRGTWKLRGEIEAIVRKIEVDRVELREQLTEEHSDVMKQFGDSLSAVREKIRDGELWNRDNFVRRSDFQTVVESITRSMEALGARVDAGFTKLDSKIDKLQSRA